MPLLRWWEFINDFWQFVKWHDAHLQDPEIIPRAERLLNRHGDLPIFREFVKATLYQWALEDAVREERKKRKEAKKNENIHNRGTAPRNGEQG